MDKLEEVKKLKQLLDDGIIDEDDFKNKKAQILGITSKEDHTEVQEPETEVKTKSKSLDDYEKELLEQSDKEEKSSTKANDDYYQQEKIKERAKLDAQEEIRSKRRAEQKAVVDKGVNTTKRVLKWILAVALWLFAIGSFCVISTSGIYYLPIGILALVLGCMACPKITDKTQKFEAYTIHKTAIVWILVIALFVVMIAFSPNNDNESNNTNSNQTNVTEVNN